MLATGLQLLAQLPLPRPCTPRRDRVWSGPQSHHACVPDDTEEVAVLQGWARGWKARWVHVGGSWLLARGLLLC